MHSNTTSPALAKRQRRAGRIRRSAVGSALATFAVVWAAIFFQLVLGHDPALSKPRAQTQPAAAAPQTTSEAGAEPGTQSGTEQGTESGAEPEAGSDDGWVPDATAAAPATTSPPLGSVTTRQS